MIARGGPLEGVRILSLAYQFPGPYATMLMADLGADVIIVERPVTGDPTRRFRGHFDALNRNKRSVVLDLKSEGGRDFFLRLARTADAVVEGFRPGVMERLGLGPDVLRAANPDLIVVSISVFGQDGPLSDRAGHDLSAQGASGYVGADGLGPWTHLPLADLASSMFAVIGVLTGLLRRDSEGYVKRIDISMVDSLVSWQTLAIGPALNGDQPAPYPARDPGYGVFRTRDDVLLILSIAGEDHQWRALCEVLDVQELSPLTATEREGAGDGVARRIADAVRHRDSIDLEERLSRGGVSVGRVSHRDDVLSSEHVRARRLVVDVDDAPGLRAIRQPIRFDGFDGVVTRPSPALGEHTFEIARELGYSPTAARQLAGDTGT